MRKNSLILPPDARARMEMLFGRKERPLLAAPLTNGDGVSELEDMAPQPKGAGQSSDHGSSEDWSSN